MSDWLRNGELSVSSFNLSVESTCAVLALYTILVFGVARLTNYTSSDKQTLQAGETTALSWYNSLCRDVPSTYILDVEEWKNINDYRGRNGWKGNDFMHAPNSPVRIYDYIMYRPGTNEDRSDVAIVSAVHFTENAESHKGLCHGGTMCAVMDDAIGWCGFCESGECIPWSGYTVQVNTKLMKAIPLESCLKLEAWIDKREGSRKIHVNARIYDAVTGIEHARAEGLFLKSTK